MEGNRRRFFRIKYGDRFRPILEARVKEGEAELEWKEYKVIDISERGMRFSGEEVSGFRPKSKIEAEITFSDGETFQIEGEVLRITGNQVAVGFSEGVPFSRIINELKLNLRKF